MNDAAYVDYGPQITPVTSSPLWVAAPAGLEQYWGWNDPRWGSWGLTPESMKYPINDIWDKLLRQSGFSGDIYTSKEVEAGIGFDGQPYYGSIPDYTPEAKAGIDRLRAAGYDVRQKHPDRRTFNTYYGLVTPSGEVQDIKIRGSDLGDAIMPMIKVFGAGLGLAGLGAGINSLLGGAGAGANALGGLEALAGVPTDAAFAAGMGADAGMAALGGGANALTAADLAGLSPDVLGQISQAPPVEIANFPPLGDRTVTNVMAGGTGGAETAVLPPATTPSVDATNLLIPERAPLLPPSGQLTPLTPFPETSGIVPTPPTFTPSTLAVKPTAGIMEGMVPGGLSGATGYPAIAEAAATNSLLSGLNAGALGAGGIGGVEGAAAAPVATAPVAAAPATVAATAPTAATVAEAALPVAAATGAGADSATRAALYGTEGYGAGMTGAQTGAYDTVLGATGSKAAADVAANVVGAGGSILDKAIDLIKSPAGGAILSGVGSVVGGITQANAAEAAANQQAEAARNALALQREMFEYQKNLLAPYQKYGTAALERLSGALGLEGAAKPQQALEMDPGYGFRLGEGLKALERMQAARGSMLSGGAMKAGQRYAQDYASGEYGNAYNRLANIAGLGQTAGTQLGGAAQQFGQTAGNVMGQEANALAAGRIGRGSAYGNAIQGGLNAYSNYLNQQQQNQLFRDIFGRTAIGN